MWVIYTAGKWSLLFFSLGAGISLFITLIFSLMKAGRKADEGEERILEILSPEYASSSAEGATVQLTEASITK
jgi:hypothetical protein